MKYIKRTIETLLRNALNAGRSVLLLGPRQVGKTTLLKQLGEADLFYTLLDPELRLRLEKSPNVIRQEIKAYRKLHGSHKRPLVIIDEIQKVPALMDIVQLIIDEQEAQFILTGSSVQKLRRHAQFNLLPGRVINLHLDPFMLEELSTVMTDITPFLLYGSLPGIYLNDNTSIRQADLESYTINYLQEEVRGEALVRNLDHFGQFLELVALESGNQLNMNKLSQELGIGRHTMSEYFKILEDCLLIESIEPITKTTSRKRLTKSPKFLLFDMGIRRVLAREGEKLSTDTLGRLFEQFIGLELIRSLRAHLPTAKLCYWRDHAGPEVDYVIDYQQHYLPIKVKWTDLPTAKDAKHLLQFMADYQCIWPGYIICRCDKPLLLHENVIALPWQVLPMIVETLQKNIPQS